MINVDKSIKFFYTKLTGCKQAPQDRLKRRIAHRDLFIWSSTNLGWVPVGCQAHDRHYPHSQMALLFVMLI